MGQGAEVRTHYLRVTTGETRQEPGNLKEAGKSLLQHLQELLLVLEAPGVAGVSKASPCHDKPQSSPVPRPGWAGALHNVPQPGLHCLARVRMRNAACSAWQRGLKAHIPGEKTWLDFKDTGVPPNISPESLQQSKA